MKGVLCRHFSIQNGRSFSSFANALNLVKGKDKSAYVSQSKSLYVICKEQAERNLWHKYADIPDDFHSKHALLNIHIWLIHQRLLTTPDAHARKAIQELFFDEFWEDTLLRIREAGVAEMMVNKRLRETQSWSLPMALEFDEVLAKCKENNTDDSIGSGALADDKVFGDEEEEIVDGFAGIVWRTVYLRNESISEDVITQVARYIRSEQLSLALIPNEAVVDARFKFDSVCSFLPDVGQEALLEEEALSRLEWRKALALDGKPFYWNMQTRETTWIKPDELRST